MTQIDPPADGPTAPPRTPARPTATFRASPEDFVVDEIPAYAPTGTGEHVYVTFRKVDLTTPEAVKRIARALGADARDAGFAGMKDRHAVTTQTASFLLHDGAPGRATAPDAPSAAPVRDPKEILDRAAIDGVTILGVARHGNKLKPGHLVGNRFRVALRDLDPASVDAIAAELRAIGERGVPNAFGPQRFGRDGGNPARAIEWLAGKSRGPRDKRDQRMLFSALQSLWFNEVLARREADGTWDRVLPGDLAKKSDTGGMFLVPLEGPEADDAIARNRARELFATGPMFGKKMRWPEGRPAEIEREILSAAIGDASRLDAWGHLGEGTRRPLRMEVDDVAIERLADGDDGRAAIAVSFTLPKGGYATTVLGRVVHLVDATVARSPREQTGDAERLADGEASSHDGDAENG